MNNESYYYKISLSYEIPYNVLDSQDPNITAARDILYENLQNSIPEKYERFSVKLVLHQLKDTYNYLVSYDAFFRSQDGMPMQDYVDAKEIKDHIKEELEEFFNSVDCEYRQINITKLL